MEDQKLKDYFKFDEADLQANRSGQFTEKQKMRLGRGDQSHKMWSVIGGIFLLLVAALGLFIAVEVWLENPNNWGLILGLGIPFGCIWPLIFGGLGVSVLMRSLTAKLRVQLQKAEGPINITMEQRRVSGEHDDYNYKNVHVMYVGGQTFRVQPDLTKIMAPGDVYGIYFAQGNDNSDLSAKDILSAELISKAK
jgi:hypothetical protein